MVIFAPPKKQALATVNKTINDLYGDRVRVRVGGICIIRDRILLVNHSLYGKETDFWVPPGGGIQFGESAESALKREFIEETGLNVVPGALLFINEHIQPPLHAIELFCRIDAIDGVPVKGIDPELPIENQIITDVRFMTFQEINALPGTSVHSLFSRVKALEEIFALGHYVSRQRSGFDI
jgi:8-oxo-dGTP diphosphatase